MKIEFKKNEGSIDRLLRFCLGSLFIIVGFFWIGGNYSIISYIFGIIILFSVLSGYSGVYHVLGITTLKHDQERNLRTKYKYMILMGFLFVVLIVLISHYWTKHILIEETFQLNQYYKSTYYYALRGERHEAIVNYDYLKKRLDDLNQKYANYRPYVLKGDANFERDFSQINEIVNKSFDKIHYGNLSAAFVELSSVRPIYNEFLIRNNLAGNEKVIAEFYEVFNEIIWTAENGKITQFEDTSPLANSKLVEMERLYPTSTEVKFVRMEFQTLKNMAQREETNNMTIRAKELKKRVMEVYVKLS